MLAAMHGRALIFAVCLCEALFLLPLSSFSGLVPTFAAEWGLSNTEAGWISGGYYLAYMFAVPLLMALTDRVDARLVLMGGCAIGAVAAVGFALSAAGFWSALAWRALGGIGLAASYMPGLKVLNDRNRSAVPSRALVSYTATYSLGVGLSFLAAGELETAFGWQTAFFVAALGPALALLVVLFALRPQLPAAAPQGKLLDFRPVFANRTALGYILGYAGHCHELLAMRAWIVAFLTFAASRAGGDAILSPTLIAALITVVGVPSSILGNEMSLRFGRRRVVITIMTASTVVSLLVALTIDASYWLMLACIGIYAVTVTADSGSLTAGTVAAADPRRQGATMAVHSTFGFATSFLGPLIVGVVLDLAGGGVLAWVLAFASMGLGAALGALAVARLTSAARR
jgi:MFS family permease